MLDLNITTDRMKAMTELLENRKWFDENIEAIQKDYRGKIVAVDKKEIVGSGKTIDEVKSLVKDKHDLEKTMIIMVPADKVVEVPYPE